MPEVPDAQGPSTEEVKLSTESESQPQPSNLDLDKQTVEQQQPSPNQPSSVPPSEGGNVVPIEPEVGVVGDDAPIPYKEGDSYSFTAPNGESYSIMVTKVEEDKITLQNSVAGTAPITVSLKQAQEILESPARSR